MFRYCGGLREQQCPGFLRIPILLSPCLSVPRLNQYHLSLLFLRGGKGGCSGSVSFLSPLGAGERHFLLPPPPPVSSRQIGNFFRPPFLLLGVAKTATSVSLYIDPLRGHVHPHIPFSRKKRRSRKGFFPFFFAREFFSEKNRGKDKVHVCHLLPTAISFPRGFSYVPQKEEKAKPLFFSKSSFFPSQKKRATNRT